MAASEWEHKMNLTTRTIIIISADPDVTQGCIDELAAFGGRYRTPTAISIGHAREEFENTPPTVVFLDESAINSRPEAESLESAVSSLTESAPVVVAAAAGRQ